MRVLITGVSGLLGLNAALQWKDRHEVSGIYYSHPVTIEDARIVRLDLLDSSAVAEAVTRLRPETIFHTAGLTNVDACEANPEGAEGLHVRASEHIAAAARQVGARLVHVSTDHLSNGTKSFVAEDAQPQPLNEYARTKGLAERAVARICPEALIIRTNFFGWGTPVKASFSDWILEGLRRGAPLPLFVDVQITPILINSLVDVIEELLWNGATGTFNVVGGERVSKYDFAVKMALTFGYPIATLRPVSVEDVQMRATRPHDMSLSAGKVSSSLGRRMPSIGESLSRLKELGEQGWPERIRRAMEFQKP